MTGFFFLKLYPISCLPSDPACPPAVCMHLFRELCLGWHPGPSCRSGANLRQAGYPRGTLEPEAASWPATLHPKSRDSSHTHTHTQSSLYLTTKNSIDLSKLARLLPLLNTHTFRHTHSGHVPKSCKGDRSVNNITPLLHNPPRPPWARQLDR